MASDLSFNIVALDRASQVFIKVAEQLDRVSEKIDRLDGKDATVDVKVKTDESTKALDSFSNRFALMAAGIVAGSPAIGAAIIGGVGAGFIGMAVLAQKSNEQVQQTYKTLWSNVVQDTKQATSGLVPILVASGNQIGATFDRLGPLMQRGFAAAGPEVAALTRGVTAFATNAMPGAVSMAERGQVVFSALANVAGTLGTSVGHAFTEIGNNASAVGSFVTGLGNILSTVLGLAVSLMNNVAQVWQRSGASITQALQGVANVAAGLASGAVPVLSAALNAAANIVSALTSLLSPLSGGLGFVATAALVAWAAFKGASVIKTGIEALSTASFTLGDKLTGVESAAKKSAAAMAASEASGAGLARGVAKAADAGVTAATSFGTFASKLAGPLSIAISVVSIGLGLLTEVGNKAKLSTEDLAATQDTLTSALEQSKGAIDGAVVSALASDANFKKVTESAKQFGVSQQDLSQAVLAGGKPLDDLKTKLEGVAAAHTKMVATGPSATPTQHIDDEGKAAKTLIGNIDDLINTLKASKAIEEANRQSVVAHTSALLNTGDAFQRVSDAASAAGVGFGDASASMTFLGSQAKDASGSLDDLVTAFSKAALGTGNAAGAIASTFKQADQQVVESSRAVADARHSVEQASRAVADAQHGEAQAAQQVQQAQQGVAAAEHGVEQAQRSLRDAIEGVSLAQMQYNNSLVAERDAEQALSDARKQAVRDIQAVHDALANSQVSEQNARLSLFNAQQAAAALGVNGQNANAIANGPITANNKDQVKAAIDLISAQNQLQQSTTQLTYAKQDSAEADKNGIEGSKGVVSAQRSLIDAQRSVQDALRGVQRAQEQVSDASYGLQQAQQGLQRAHQAVRDAAYQQQKAHQAVTDAQYAQRRASDQLSTAQTNLKNAQDNASRSLDLNTEAGRRNLGQLFTLSDAIKNQFGPTQQGYQKMVEDVAGAFGMSRDAADKYLKQLGLIPQDFKFNVTGVAQVDMTPLYDFMKDPDHQGSGGYFANAFRSAGGQLAYADGGHVRGPGGPRDDLIDARLSDNEYVHTSDAVDFWGVDFMDDVNNRRMPKALKFANGGLVQKVVNANVFGLGAGTGYEMFRNASILAGADPNNIPQLPAYVPPPPMAPGSNLPFHPGSGVGRWSNVALQAMGMLGVPSDYLGAILRRMQQESGGNPTIVNDWDTNWQAGHPSVGLMQVIANTFRSYAGPFRNTGPFSYGVSVDPLANIYAGLNYAGNRYNSHGGFLGGLLYAMNKPGGYDNGGQLQPGWTPVFNGTGKPENVRTADAEDALLQELKRLNARIDELAKRPIQGEVTIDGKKVIGIVHQANRQAELESGMV